MTPTAQPRLISEIETPAFAVEDVIMPGHLRMHGHGHDRPHLCVVLDGGFHESGTLMTEGMLRCSPGGDTHDIDFVSAGARCFLVTLSGPLESDAPLPAGRTFRNAHAVLPVIERLQRDVARGSLVHCHLLVLEMMARVALPLARRSGIHPPRWLERVRQRLDDEPFLPPTTETLAREAGLHPVYVARAFRAWFGCSLAGYARLVRLDRAVRLMLETREPLVRIAAVAGYADQSHLTRAVRAATGLTPRALRTREVSRVQDLRGRAG